MKKLLMVLILIWPIAGFCQTHIRDRQTGDTARVIDGKLQTSATLSGTVTTATNINIGTVGDTAIAQTNGIQTVYDLSPKATSTTSFPSGSTNSSGQLVVVLTNSPVTISNTVTIQGNVGFTNSTAGMTNNAGDYLETAPRASTNNIGGTLPAFAATPTFKGWPMYEVSATLTNYLDVDLVAGDALNTNGLVFTGFTNALILSISYLCSSNQTAAQSPTLLLTTNALTWVNASAAAAVSAAEIPYQLEHYDFGTNGLETIEGTTFRAFGNTSKCTVNGKSAITPTGITTLYGYLKTRAAITNCANDIIRIRYQNSY